MTIIYDEPHIKINIYDLIADLSDDAKLDLIESLSCHDAVIKHVTDQIITGWTERVFHGPKGDCEEKPFHALDIAVREISKKSSDIAKKEIERLEEAIGKAHAQRKAIDDKYWDLYHKNWDLYHKRCIS